MTKLIIKNVNRKEDYEEGTNNLKNAGFRMTGKIDNHEFWNNDNHEITFEVVLNF